MDERASFPPSPLSHDSRAPPQLSEVPPNTRTLTIVPKRRREKRVICVPAKGDKTLLVKTGDVAVPLQPRYKTHHLSQGIFEAEEGRLGGVPASRRREGPCCNPIGVPGGGEAVEEDATTLNIPSKVGSWQQVSGHVRIDATTLLRPEGGERINEFSRHKESEEGRKKRPREGKAMQKREAKQHEKSPLTDKDGDETTESTASAITAVTSQHREGLPNPAQRERKKASVNRSSCNYREK
ncbi:hypothetical protein E2C01_025498 [Portunus trituberculatus]|uniref:Uncharacterized protein n=1 Tax=Portunus trituberculatus TaxID=210409 RepID=A0A5B7EDI4_PORTR|nr:hypothetical protein [Portunus trituberculatus]